MIDEENIVECAERVLAAFGQRIALTTTDVLEALDGREDLTSRCLGFLRDRDEILLVPNRPILYHRAHVVDEVCRRLRECGRQRPAEIADGLGIPVAIVCEALGWLEQEGRVTSRHQADDDVTFELD